MSGKARPYRVLRAAPEHAAGLSRLFEAADVPCHCRYHHFEGDTGAWLERCASAPGANRSEFERALEAGHVEALGLVALEGGPDAGPESSPDALPGSRVVGWLKLAPAASLPKLYGNRLYRGLPCLGGDREGVFTVGCLVVLPSRRRVGVARALVEGAVRIAPSLGARYLEALPRRPDGPVAPAELWTGPASVFEEAGFEELHAVGPYPVLRLALDPGRR